MSHAIRLRSIPGGQELGMHRLSESVKFWRLGTVSYRYDSGAMTIDQHEFRNALGCFASGVTVVTTLDEDGGPVGLTINSFSSLSLDPPLVLFCLDRKVTSFDAFQNNRHFAVNVLAEGQEELSRRFAQVGSDKWVGIEFSAWDSGCPIFEDCLANIECDVDTIFEGGDHVVITGTVKQFCYDEDGARPLLFYRGSYGRLPFEDFGRS